MKVAVFGDIHGNLPALEIMLKDAGKVDAYICLGDIVDYGPWSNECVERITSLKHCTVVKGNHERYFSSGKYDGKNELVEIFFNICISGFRKYDLISNFQERYILGGYLFVHTIVDKVIYPDSKIDLDGNYVIGHSHHQFILKQGLYTLYNAGSVGQNRIYVDVINYLIYYPEVNKFELRNITYNENLIIDEMKARKYPQVCIDYYNNKKRKRRPHPIIT